MRVLVTGGAGFIGSALIRHLVDIKGWAVTNVDKLTYASSLASLTGVSSRQNYTLVRADVCDAAVVQRVLARTQPDAIFHLAAESHVDRSITGSGDFVNTNIVGTYTLLEAARKYWSSLTGEAKSRFRFVHVSTDEVFGSIDAPDRFVETSRYDPRSPYAATKASSDHLVRAWHETYGLPAIVTNCSNNYGPYQFPEKLVPLIILSALDGKSLPVYGDGRQVRDWLYVDDHVKALTLVAERGRPGATYNIGGREVRENIEVVGTLCDFLDVMRPAAASYRDLITHVEDRPGHDRRYAIDPDLIETELGWRAGETFLTGMRRTIDWYLKNESWWRPIRRSVYSGSRLGLPAYAQNEIRVGRSA